MREDVKKIYDENRDIFWGRVVPHDDPDQPRKYYIYEWFTVSTNKVFYVGKGTGSRVRHILKEIEEFEKNPRKYKGSHYKILKDHFGIDYRIVMDNLTDEESQIMELYTIVQRLLDDHPLLQSVIPWESGGLTEKHFEDHIKLMSSRTAEDLIKFYE